MRARIVVYGVHAALTLSVLVMSFFPVGQRHTDALTTIFALGIAANTLGYFYMVPAGPSPIVSALTCLLVGTAVLAAWSSRRAVLVRVPRGSLALTAGRVAGVSTLTGELTTPLGTSGVQAHLRGPGKSPSGEVAVIEPEGMFELLSKGA